ncbi:Hypp7903 [Branchiostoma lanceolatum]|uniref:Hypp7903 protein n=1 Tax=Branchiostoma lanceolatum TaxID=7740 RepID=A0A8J9Z4C1_BRALA|nr:Hypp7903 [Branchiostoma lanceolatum]
MQGYEFESPAAAEYICINGQFSPPGPYPNCRKSEGECGYEFESPAAAEYVCINGQFSPPGPYPNCRKSEGE